jgi:hypothetical protein
MDCLRRLACEVLEPGFCPFVVAPRAAQRYPIRTAGPVANAVDEELALIMDHDDLPVAIMPNKFGL